jgi:glutathione S-transferase
MSDPVLFGAAYSVYVRTVRLALAERCVPYRLVEIDIFAPEGPPADYAARHPFNRIPAFEHDGFRLYETGAIARYVDEAFPGPSLVPDDVRARMHHPDRASSDPLSRRDPRRSAASKGFS